MPPDPSSLRAELRADLSGNRRELRLQIGPYQVVVTEVPAASLSEVEWRDVLLARLSYTAMWGGDRELITDDPCDGRDRSSPYDVHHYMAWVRMPGTFEGGKLVTMRKLRLIRSRLSAKQMADPFPLLPVDVQFWCARTAGSRVPLWEPLRDVAGFQWTVIGRVGTFPYGKQEPTIVARERTAVAFAAIQLLAAHRDGSRLWIISLCPEFRDRVLSVRDGCGDCIVPEFTRIEEHLGLPPRSICLDNDLAIVRRHKTLFPGYFVDNADAARVLAALLDGGQLTVADLRPTIGRLVEAESAIGGAGRELEELVALDGSPDHARLAELLTRPRLFKYLAQLLAGDDPLTRMSAAELRTRLLFETGDGPFSSAVHPVPWAERARSLLLAVDGKYPRRPR